MLPFIYITNSFYIDTYLLLMGVAISITYILSKATFNYFKIEQTQTKNQTRNQIKFLFIGCIVYGWILAKLLFASVIYLKFNLNLLFQLNFWFSGGVVFYGGLIGGLLFFIQYSLIMKKFNPTHAIYFLPSLCIGLAIGRIGCFLSGCCYGKQCNYFWGIEIYDRISRHPVQIYEVIFLLILATIIFLLIKKKFVSLIIFSTFFSGHSIIRLILENFRGDENRGVWQQFYAFSTSQIIAIFIIGFNIALYVYLFFYKRKRL
ncbi:MAG: prolipoprotein diacylglyceryl transferase [Oligoflexia bacterium]|nr:prolipoprotein diacylglyceryl transferase [Oligoflexia bacterium]